MSKKLQASLSSKPKVHVIELHEFGFMTDITNMQYTMNHYYDQLKNNYLQQVAMRLGYELNDDLEISIDMKSDKREITVKKVN